jgi:DNA repair protein RadC
VNNFKTYFADLKDKEHFLCTFLDNQNKVISTKIMSSGTINEAPIYARELLKEALMHDANTVIVAHNHPGGTPYPSRADMKVTKVINQALASVSINLLDHIIVADNNFYSFADHGNLKAAILGDFSVMETSIKDRMVAAKEQSFKSNIQKHLTKEQSIR